jgi:hypothetical protein
MKKLSMILLFIIFSSSSFYSQIGVKLSSLQPDELKEYIKPASTWFGTIFNSGTYYDADVPEVFGFKFNVIGMWTLVPEDQKTFQPKPNIAGVGEVEPTATVFGNQSSYFLSSNGFYTYPAGFALNAVPSAMYQVAGSLFNTELMIRFYPSTQYDKIKVGLFGFGIKHDISSHIPLFPVDLSVQLLYNHFNLKHDNGDVEDYTDVKSNNIAFNVHASKKLASVFIAYAGLQYESSTMDLEYYYEDPNNLYPELANKNHKLEIDGDNHFRFTLGGALKLGYFVMNADVNLTKLTTFTLGLSLDI